MDKINFTTITLLVLLISSFAISAILQKRFGRASVLAGIEFIIVGAVLGDSMGFGLLDASRLAAFTPLISLIIGLFGFFFGLEVLHVKVKSDISLAGMLYQGTLLVLSAVILFYLSIMLFPELAAENSTVIGRESFQLFGTNLKFTGSDAHLWLGLTLGSMAAVSSVEAVRSAIKRNNAVGPISKMIPQLTAPGEVIGIFIFGAVFAAARALDSASTLGWTITEWTVAVIGIGVFMGLLFWLFVGKENDDIKTYLATIGIVTLASGIAVAVGVSPLFLNFICGATLALSSPVAEKIAETLNGLRGPLTIMVLFFAGAMVKPISIAALILPLIFIAIRTTGLFSLSRFCLKSIPGDLYAPGLGRVFLFQDVLIVVMGLDLVVRGLEISQFVLGTAIISFVVFGVVGNIGFRRFALDSCEAEAVEPELESV